MLAIFPLSSQRSFSFILPKPRPNFSAAPIRGSGQMWYVGQTIQSEGDGERMEAITASQLRAARGLLGLSQRDLAVLSKVSRATIADFEAGKRQPYPRTLADLQRCLEGAGVAFTTDDDLLGVRIKRAHLPVSHAASSPARPVAPAKPKEDGQIAQLRRRV